MTDSPQFAVEDSEPTFVPVNGTDPLDGGLPPMADAAPLVVSTPQPGPTPPTTTASRSEPHLDAEDTDADDEDEEDVDERGLPVGQVAAGGASIFSIIGLVIYQTIGVIGLAVGGLLTLVLAVGYLQHRRGGKTGPGAQRAERTVTTRRTTSGTGGGSLLGGGGGGRRSGSRHGGGAGSLLPSLGLPKGTSGRSRRATGGTGGGRPTGSSSRTAGRGAAAAGTGGIRLPLFKKKGTTGTGAAGGGSRGTSSRGGSGGRSKGRGTGTGTGGSSTGTSGSGTGGTGRRFSRGRGRLGSARRRAASGARAWNTSVDGGGRVLAAKLAGRRKGRGTETGVSGSSASASGSGTGTSRRRFSRGRGRLGAARRRAVSGARVWNAGVDGGGRVLAAKWAARRRRVKAFGWRRATWSARGRRVRAFDWRLGAWRTRWARMRDFDWKAFDWTSVLLSPAAPEPTAQPDSTSSTEPTSEPAEAAPAEAAPKDTSPGPRRPVRAGQQRDDVATRPVTSYGRTPTAMSGNPLVIGTADVANAATTYAPEDMWVVDKDLQLLPEMSINMAIAVRNLHLRLDAEYPIHPSVTEILMQLHDAIAATAGIADQLSQQFQAVHAVDIARRLAPRTNEQMWNV